MIFAPQEKTTGVCGFASGLLGTICNEKNKKRAVKHNSWTICLYNKWAIDKIAESEDSFFTLSTSIKRTKKSIILIEDK